MQTCDKHPGYRAIRKPRVDCDECWDLFVAAHPEKFENLGSAEIDVSIQKDKDSADD